MKRPRLSVSELSDAACVVVLLICLSACASTDEQTGTARVAADPSPIGVPENATPEERGREILRVVVELIKHGDLRDTEFASRLLRIPIEKDQAVGWLGSEKFPQHLATIFGYDVRRHMLTHRVSFGLDPARTCLLQTDLLSTFQREFGVGTA